MKNSRQRPSINAGSMADIAFLLLIFFLTTTTIYNDLGLMVTLPDYYEGPIGKLAERNVAVLRINEGSDVLLEKSQIDFKDIQPRLRAFILNPDLKQSFPAEPKDAVVSIVHGKNVAYETYMNVFSEVKAAYRTVYDEYSMMKFGSPFAQLPNAAKNIVRADLPIKISEAESNY